MLANIAATASMTVISMRIDRIVVPPGLGRLLPSLTPAAPLSSSGSFVIFAFQREPLDHGFAAEPFTQAVDRLFGPGAAAVDEVGEIGAVGIAQIGEPDADEPKHRAVSLAREQFAPDRKDARGKLGRMGERLRSRANAEIGALELERHGRAGERIRLETGGNFFGEAPQPQLQGAEIGDVAIEGGLGRNALGLALSVHRPV